MAKKLITKSWLRKSSKGILPATYENITKARSFAFEKWIDRAVESGLTTPVDLSSSCKFCSLFVKQIFGGSIKGNYDHQYNVIDGIIVDLSADSEDVRYIEDPYRHDELFFGSVDHLDSLMSCLPRIENWTELFLIEMGQELGDKEDVIENDGLDCLV